VFTTTLRTKFLLSLLLIIAVLTSAVLLIVRFRVQVHERNEIVKALDSAVVTFLTFQRQRETTLERSAALLATLPPLMAVMTTRDPATIQDASTPFWKLSGSQVFVMASPEGELAAIHAEAPNFPLAVVRDAVKGYLAGDGARDWWFGDGHLYQVFFEPIYFGAEERGHPIGILAVGYEVDASLAADVSRVASGHVGFGYGGQLVVSTVEDSVRDALNRQLTEVVARGRNTTELLLDSERFLATSVSLSEGPSPGVTLTVLKSFDAATAFLDSLNRWIVAVGIVAILVGGGFVFVASSTFTRPLAQLVSGVRALERGDYVFPLDLRGSDEVSALTMAFRSMRQRLQETQRQLLEAEQLATIGTMASTISHDLRHPLTAVLAYAEYLSDRNLSEAQRKDFYQEIRIAVNRMLDQISSLLGFSKQAEALQLTEGYVEDVIDRAIKTMKAAPEFEATLVTFTPSRSCLALFDPAKLERVILNLLLNAGEAVSPESGQIHVTCTATLQGTEVRVADNGPGIPEPILDSLFRPFVSYGKEKGIGLGLTVVHSIMQQHHGEVRVESTGPTGTVFLVRLPPSHPVTQRMSV